MDEEQNEGQQPEQVDERKKPGPKPKRDAYKNIANGPVHICGKRVHPNGVCELTVEQKKDTKAMKRLERAVELGLVEKV